MKLSIYLFRIRDCNIDLRRRILDTNSRNALSRKKKIIFCGEEDIFGTYVSKLVFFLQVLSGTWQAKNIKGRRRQVVIAILSLSPLHFLLCLHSSSSPVPPRHLHQPQVGKNGRRVEHMCQSQLRPDVGIEEENSGEKYQKESKSYKRIQKKSTKSPMKKMGLWWVSFSFVFKVPVLLFFWCRSGSDFPFWCRSRSRSYLLYISWKIRIF